MDAQVATANSIPWSSTAKFSRNGVLVAPLRVTRDSENGLDSDAEESPRERRCGRSVLVSCRHVNLTKNILPADVPRAGGDSQVYLPD